MSKLKNIDPPSISHVPQELLKNDTCQESARVFEQNDFYLLKLSAVSRAPRVSEPAAILITSPHRCHLSNSTFCLGMLPWQRERCDRLSVPHRIHSSRKRSEVIPSTSPPSLAPVDNFLSWHRVIFHFLPESSFEKSEDKFYLFNSNKANLSPAPEKREK